MTIAHEGTRPGEGVGTVIGPYKLLEPIGEDRCKLRLTTVATFQSGLTMKIFEQELAMMTVACQRGLIKLKVHAELGVEAVRAVDSALDG